MRSRLEYRLWGIAGDLFSDSAQTALAAGAPLAQRLRPGTLEEFEGQSGVVGEASGLRRAIAADRVPSMIFHGPPGSGKTTLARIVAHSTRAHFEELSAVQTGVPDVRRVLRESTERLGATGQRTILFLDEIHRFNKAQQDALLPAVESGLVTLIGATTENPYFEVNSALLSRCQLFSWSRWTEAALGRIVERGVADARGRGGRRRAEHRARGRRRRPQRAERRWRRRPPPPARGAVDGRARGDAARKRRCCTTRAATSTTTSISAFIKSLRGSDADAAVYWLAVMIAGGEDPKFIARRMIVFASEDVGNADPRALEVAVAAARRSNSWACRSAASTSRGGRLPGPRAQVERRLRGHQRGHAGRP